MARVVFTRAAREDLRQIRLYIAQDSPAAATRMVRLLRLEAARLGQHPQLGRSVPEYADPTVRELIVAPYRLIYRYQPEHNRVQIVGVIHAGRLLPPLADQT